MYIQRAQGVLSLLQTFVGVLEVVTDNIYFKQQYNFPFKVIINWLILIQKNTYCQRIKTEEYPEYKFYDNI